jgi:Putative DNA-binding domain
MPSVRETTDLDAAGFRAAILDPAVDKPSTVTGPRGKQAVKRFNVYRNNVTVSLISSLADIFPAVKRITGEMFFRDMARLFVRAHPPVSPLLFLYGHDFPAFIETFEYAEPIPYLADVARIERAWLTAYHAADLPPLAPARLGEIDPEKLGDAVFKPHPATGLVISRFAAFDIFDANRNHETVGRIEIARPQSVLVTRPGQDVVVTALPDGHDGFFKSLIAGETLAQAAATGADSDSAFDINEAIGGLFATGAFVTVETA